MTVRRATSLGLAVLAVVACRGPHPGRPAGSCTHVQAMREVRGTALCEDVWTCARPPDGRFDRVGLHRLAPCPPAGGPIAPIVLYLPGMHMNSELTIANPRQDFRLYLAAAGVRTWGLDYRTHAVPADASAGDLATLKDWTADVFLDDVLWATRFVRGADKGPIYVAGFSHGAALAYRFAARPDHGVAGLIVLDGAVGTARPLAGGDAVIDVGGRRLPFAERQRLLAEVMADPARPSPVAGYASAGEALADILYSAESFGGHGGLANTRDGVSDVRMLATLLDGYDRWWPRAVLEAPPAALVTRPLPVIAFASTNLGADWVERVKTSAHSYGGSSAIVRELPGYGHLDVLVGHGAARDVFEPALAWLRSMIPP